MIIIVVAFRDFYGFMNFICLRCDILDHQRRVIEWYVCVDSRKMKGVLVIWKLVSCASQPTSSRQVCLACKRAANNVFELYGLF